MPITLEQLTKQVLALAEEKGFGSRLEDINVAEKIALIHSEVSEALKAYRHNNLNGKDGFYEELADIILRVVHLAGIYGVDLEQEIAKKMDYNKTRTWDWSKLNENHSSPQT